MNKYYFIFGEGSKINQIICAVLINMPVFVYGAAIGWMSPMTLLLQSEDSPRSPPLTDYEVSWMGAVAYIVCVPADFGMAVIGDKFGRKKAMFFLSSMGLGAWAMKLMSMQTWAFLVARTMVGVLMAGSYVTCPLYTKEISEDCIRGMLGSLLIVSHTTGNLFLYIIGDMLSYNTILWICLSLPAAHLLLFTMMPESPSYLVKKGKLEQASKALAWLRCRREDDAAVVSELQLIKKEQMLDEGTNKFALKAMLSDKVLSRAFRIALAAVMAREMCGTVPVLNFAGNIFAMASEGSGLTLSPNRQAMMLGAVQVLGSTLALSVVEKAGRKPLLLATSLLSGVSMCALGTWFVARAHGLHGADWLPIASLCICIFCDSFGLQPVSVVVIAELFSYKYRGTVMATTMATASVTDFVQMLVFKPVVSYVGVHYAFYFFGAVCLAMAVYTVLVIPETKMKNLDEIYECLKTSSEKREELRVVADIQDKQKQINVV